MSFEVVIEGVAPSGFIWTLEVFILVVSSDTHDSPARTTEQLNAYQRYLKWFVRFGRLPMPTSSYYSIQDLIRPLCWDYAKLCYCRLGVIARLASAYAFMNSNLFRSYQ